MQRKFRNNVNKFVARLYPSLKLILPHCTFREGPVHVDRELKCGRFLYEKPRAININLNESNM